MASKNKLSGMLKGAEAPTTTARMRKEEARWRAEDDLRTLQRAKEIQCDRSRMSMCKQVAREQIKALNGVAGSKTNGKRR